MGVATPLLAAFIAIDIGGFWFLAWRARESIPAIPASLLVGLAITGLYYLAASFVFPDEPEAGIDLDTHFDRNKRMVLGLVLLCNLLAHAFRLLIVNVARLGLDNPIGIGSLAVYFVLLAFAALVPSRKLSSAALLLLIALYLWDAVMSTLVSPVGS